MMSENLLSVFKKELGYVNDTNQYVELSIRITEKEHSLDLRNNLQGLAQSVNLNVSTLTEDYMCRISKSYIVNIHSCLENFLKSFKHLPGSPTNITEIKKTSEDDWLEWTLNMAFSSNKQHIPMTINAQVFNKLFDFVEQFPHYFIGSNADLIFGRNNTSMGIVWLCLGSTFLCPAPLYLKKNKENDE